MQKDHLEYTQADNTSCRVAFVVHYACGIAALLLLWAVYPKDYDFGAAAKNSILFMDAQRVGSLPSDNPIPWRSNSLLYEGSQKLGFSNLTGGWMYGGELGESLPSPVSRSTVQKLELLATFFLIDLVALNIEDAYLQ